MIIYKCLIIEDSVVQCKVIAQMMRSCGWEAVESHSLSQGIEALKSNDFNLIIADLILPDSDDGTVVQYMKEMAPNAIIAAMSASGEINNTSSLLFKAKSYGAQFLFHKPFKIERLKSLVNDVQDFLETGEREPHILVIDDSKSIRSICDNIISGMGYRVTLAEDMDFALNSVDLFDIDVIISDLNMPGKNPIEAIPYIKSKFPMVGIIVMSGDVTQDAQNLLTNGVDAIINKPFEIPNLLEALEKTFENIERNYEQRELEEQ